MNQPTADARIAEIVGFLTKATKEYAAAKPTGDLSDEVKNIYQALDDDMRLIKTVADDLSGESEKPAAPIVQLYEIDNSQGSLVLKPVTIPALQ
jgi:hypothetical protein